VSSPSPAALRIIEWMADPALGCSRAKMAAAIDAALAAEREEWLRQIRVMTDALTKAQGERAELIEALRVLAEVFQSFCNDVGNYHESYQREHIASALAIVAKHKAA
jgi:hypothetical protein